MNCFDIFITYLLSLVKKINQMIRAINIAIKGKL